jgi:hypothetical protein
MYKAKYYFLVALGLLISSYVWASPPENYIIKYNFKNPDGSVFRIIKYYFREGCKFRSEYYSTIQYNINSSAEAQVENDSVESQAEADMKTESIANPEPHTVEILRKDKNLVWSIMPEFKQYFEVSLKPDSWDRSVSGNFVSDFKDLKKTGESKLLNNDCEIYESVQKYNDVTWTNIFYVAKELKVILKSEMLQNGKLVQTMEAAEFSTEQPSSFLFEVPEGYSKGENN